MYTRDSVDRVKDAVDMADLVGAKTELRRAGGNLVGLCPFHEERTPSFSVNADKKVYYCFGCDASGDAIGFVMETEALDFAGALELLAERYGVELRRESEDPEAERRRRRRERLLALLERASRFYAGYLWQADEAAAAREYLLGRGLREETLREFGVGYAPGAWDRLTSAAIRDGFTADELLATGLSQRRREGSGLIDRFRARITFPLNDRRGRPRGFGARATQEGQQPKYLNTSEGEIFHKGRQLFGLDLARAAAAKAGRVVVTEGYTDVLALRQAGVPETVAIMGTAVTDEQLEELTRAAPRVLMALDADRSGQEAMVRTARVAEGRDVELAVAELPAGCDPADLLEQEGAEALLARLEHAIPALEFEVRRVISTQQLGTPAGVDRALELVRPLLAATPGQSMTRDHLVRYVSDRLDVPVQYVTARLTAPPTANRSPSGSAPARAPGDLAPMNERAFLAHCLSAKGPGRSYLERLRDSHLTSEVARRARDHLLTHFEDPLAALPEADPELAALVTRASMAAEKLDDYPGSKLHVDLLDLEQRRLEREIRQARLSHDRGRESELARAKQALRDQFDSVAGGAP
ncbi:MAG: DNA primase [Actinomycetota bacterium]|nr:DNA primase [Actinomycetota bacterium]MDQ3647860.1 DNA primase [Actinomycetota bacterium]